MEKRIKEREDDLNLFISLIKIIPCRFEEDKFISFEIGFYSDDLSGYIRKRFQWHPDKEELIKHNQAYWVDKIFITTEIQRNFDTRPERISGFGYSKEEFFQKKYGD